MNSDEWASDISRVQMDSKDSHYSFVCVLLCVKTNKDIYLALIVYCIYTFISNIYDNLTDNISKACLYEHE